MLQYGQRSLWKLGLLALVVFFSQVYPYVHFHHAHAESEPPVVTGALPVETDAHHSHFGQGHEEPSHNSHQNHHHHPEFDQHIDWHIVRTQPGVQLVVSDLSAIPCESILSRPPAAETCFAPIRPPRLSASRYFHSIDSRGPPALA